MRSSRATSAAGMLMAVGLGAAVWAGWLWESEYYWDEEARSFQGPYRQAQVVGCSLTYGVAAMLLGLWRRPVVVSTGMAGGFGTAWVLYAASSDQSGLFVVGAIVLAPLLLLGGAAAACCGGRLRNVGQWLRTAP